MRTVREPMKNSDSLFNYRYTNFMRFNSPEIITPTSRDWVSRANSSDDLNLLRRMSLTLAAEDARLINVKHLSFRECREGMRC